MIYRTVEVTATLSPQAISVTPVLDEHPQLSESVEGKIVEVTADIVGSIVEVSPTLSGNVSATAEILTKLAYSNMDEYEGPYTFTPSEEVQVEHTRNRTVMEDIVINPIPDNYARMSWNGSTLLFY